MVPPQSGGTKHPTIPPHPIPANPWPRQDKWCQPRGQLSLVAMSLPHAMESRLVLLAQPCGTLPSCPLRITPRSQHSIVWHGKESCHLLILLPTFFSSLTQTFHFWPLALLCSALLCAQPGLSQPTLLCALWSTEKVNVPLHSGQVGSARGLFQGHLGREQGCAALYPGGSWVRPVLS